MRLILHAGVHRTGTTALQLVLANNRTELALQGFAYPFDKPNHQEVAWALHRREMSGEDLIARLEPLRRSKAHTIILSGEDFSVHRDLDWLEVVSREYEVGVVFYLRRQDDWIMSWYNQHVKWPFDREKSQLSPQEFLATIDSFYWLDYEALLRRWADALGDRSVTVAVVEAQQLEDVVHHFADVVGLDISTMTLDEARQNDSLPIHILEIARNLRLAELKPRDRVTLIAALRSALKDKASGLSTVYSPSERNTLLERFADSNRAVARRFFDRVELFMTPPPKPDEPYFAFPEIERDELLREWVTPVIMDLLRRTENG